MHLPILISIAPRQERLSRLSRVALCIALVVVGATAAYSAHTAKTNKVTSLVSQEECESEFCKNVREECCLSMSTKRGAGYNACMNGHAGDWDFGDTCLFFMKLNPFKAGPMAGDVNRCFGCGAQAVAT